MPDGTAGWPRPPLGGAGKRGRAGADDQRLREAPLKSAAVFLHFYYISADVLDLGLFNGQLSISLLVTRAKEDHARVPHLRRSSDAWRIR